jgi:hypothetical protein
MMAAFKKLNIIILAIAFVFCLIAASDPPNAKVYGRELGYEIKPGKNMPGEDLEIIRKRIINDLLTPSVEADKINQLLKSIRPMEAGRNKLHRHFPHGISTQGSS